MPRVSADAEVTPTGFTGAQYEIVLRCGGALTIAGGVGVLALLPAFPPTRLFGTAGWPVVIVFALVAIGLGTRLVLLIDRPPGGFISVLAAAAIAELGVLEWFAGGGRAPYTQLLLLPGLGVAVGHSRRRSLALSLAMDAAAFSPALYSRIDALDRGVEFGVVTFMIVLIATVFTSSRAHREVLQRAGEDASELAHRDALTGLRNRRAFDAALAELAAIGPRAARACLLFLDVDQFKRVNDVFGHLAGDDALRGVAAAVTQAIRPSDLAFRWAGDEFAVLVRELDVGAAGRLADRIRLTVAQVCRLPDGTPVRVTIGVSAIMDPDDVGAVLDRADRALLAQKTQLVEA